MKNTNKIILNLTLLFMSFAAFAQAPPPPPATPIDGGLSLLLAGGAAYGLKKLNDSRKEK